VLKTLIEEGPKVIENKNDYEAAANFMWSATMALNGILSRGCVEDWSTHVIGHELTA
jgi:NADP-dependent alcohol dehydrogenase